MLDTMYYTVMVLFLIICAFLVLVVLIQKGRGGGLASAFGGAGGNTAFGSKTGDVLTWATSIVFGVFLILAVALNLLANKRNEAAAGPIVPIASAGQPVQSEASPPPAPAPQAAPTTVPTTNP